MVKNSKPKPKKKATISKAKKGDKRLGNQFWLARSSHGAKPKFAKAEDLLSACHEYFQWCEDNPLYEGKVFSYQGKITHTKVAKMRAMTIGGLCSFLDITEVTWREWRINGRGLSKVVKQVEVDIRNQKFSGAAADLLNANIIARDLGMADKAVVIPVDIKDAKDMDADQLTRAIKNITEEG